MLKMLVERVDKAGAPSRLDDGSEESNEFATFQNKLVRRACLGLDDISRPKLK